MIRMVKKTKLISSLFLSIWPILYGPLNQYKSQESLFVYIVLVPTATDGDLTICESRAIIQYAFNRYAPDSEMYPKNPAERAQVDMLLYYDQGTFYKTVAKYIYNSLGIR